MSFSYDRFESLLSDIKASGLRFCRFDDARMPAAAGSSFFLRHDVDISPLAALAVGRIAREQGVVSNLFFQLNAETYTLLSPANLGIIGQLREMGHCVGLHIDSSVIASDEDAIAHTIDWFSRCVAPIDPVVSFHRPNVEVLSRRYERFVSAYDPRFFAAERYCSDSRRRLDFVDKLGLLLTKGTGPLQLLLHPEWWCAVETVEEFWAALRVRRDDELKRYLLANFPKVFEGRIECDDLVHRL
jgi:hypothetical protein